MTSHPDEPAFLDDDGPSADLPAFIPTTNARELYGLRPGETVAQAITRNQTEQAGKVRPLTADERAELHQEMTEAAAWMRAELARRRTKKEQP